MPGQPPRHSPGRESTRPGAGRGTHRGRGIPFEFGEQDMGQAEEVPNTPQGHAAARSRVISTLATGANRIIALVATFAVFLVSFVSGLSVYINQQKDIAQTRAEIAAQQSEIAQLQDELQRWQDPAYVRAQARDRLGWVMPGEIGYRVVDENGEVIGGTVSSLDTTEETEPVVWYEALWSSLVSADQPAPAPTSPTPGAPATIGPDGVETPR